MEFFRNTNIDFLGKKWYFLSFSLIFSVAGVLSMVYRTVEHKFPLGVDFRGGTLVYVKFTGQPNVDQIRASLERAGLRNARIQRYDSASLNEQLIDLPQHSEAGADATHDRNLAIQALGADAPAGKLDLNNIGFGTVRDRLVARDPLHVAPQQYDAVARQILDFRDNTQHQGLFRDIDEIRQSGVPASVVEALKQDFYTSNFHVFNAETVGPQVGQQLRGQALRATFYSLVGMLVYLWFRFEMIYGVAAVVAVFHDTLITIGAFSLTNTDITLTVIAAILTLVGYSMNDTIVVFDRIRENIKIMRRETLGEVVNRSINQTLSRTILTSGLTFLTVLSLYLFGGEVLHGFSLALVIGIVIGTYSSIAVAAPMLVAYQDWRAGKRGNTPSPAAPGKVRARA